MPRAKLPWQSNFPPRTPASAWNAWFAVVVFHDGPFRWLMTQAFKPAERAPAGHPVASIEGFGDAPQSAWMAGFHGLQPPLHTASEHLIVAEAAGLDAGDTVWRWSDALEVEGTLLGRPTNLHATAVSAQAMQWLKISGLLDYRSFSADVTLRWGDEIWHGAGLLEHAWGGHLPVPASTILPGSWQWDLLWDEGEPRHLHAALTARWLGIGFSPKAFRDEGGRVRSVRTSPVDIDVDDNGIPTVWHGEIGGRAYRAERDGKPLIPFKGGAYFGFSYTMGDRRGVGLSRCLRHTPRPSPLPGQLFQPSLP